MELFNYCSDFTNEPCIYSITNKINKKMYIGKTINFRLRHYQHKTSFFTLKPNHHSPHLHSAIAKYGYKNFDISIIELCKVEELSSKELHWMEFYNTIDSNFGYNLRKDTCSGMIPHPSTRKKMSNRLKKEWALGKRNNHGLKLKESWSNNEIRKKEQSIIMSKNLTKYKYKLYLLDGSFFKTISYSELKKLKLSNCLATFYKKKSDKINFKEYIIERIKISQDIVQTI